MEFYGVDKWPGGHVFPSEFRGRFDVMKSYAKRPTSRRILAMRTSPLKNQSALGPFLGWTQVSLGGSPRAAARQERVSHPAGVWAAKDDRDTNLKPKAAGMWAWRVGAAVWGGILHEQDMGGGRVAWAGRGGGVGGRRWMHSHLLSLLLS
ncbi:hypothetical protein E2C01_044428 [Portunus trituberculatus]|uniref:Uncharacterized protein n=1 Tax=Portunus trituberculatus TaxID=210409 RepID=A0A5B7FZB2_PORTR|nr:hypothetical protein [Portunus trituberculatus]